MKRWLVWLFSKTVVLKEETFKELIKKHNLEGKVDLKVSTFDGYTLVPIMSYDGKVPDIPGNFIKELLILIFGYKAWSKQWGCFKIGQSMTEKEIIKSIDDWQWYCEMFSEACG